MNDYMTRYSDAGPSLAGNNNNGLTQAAAAIAYAGALPLIIGAILVWARPMDIGPHLIDLIILCGGALLAFFGGIRWGIAVMHSTGPTFTNLFGGIMPLLISFPIFLMENDLVRLLIIVVALPLLLFDDLRATRRGSGAPDWYLGVRLPLTVMMELAFAATLIFVIVN
ncbi:DUF3429 domain-containing protein [Parvularcula sp. IMCC14364]|uniref:DUF3429 domain-containing protein n=1 Tax=Parvularcula sp. IMCC14364 TaxID=3067902 RepID=UPI002742271F|nr:DUF3429 domain-containing protein [Parvularcula sp. IMCC14364]